MAPKVSLIVAIYNVGKFLNQCVESIIAQTAQDIEIILVDDGSKDDSGKICDDFAELDSRVRVLHQENAGVSVARNNGMKIATGEWIMFVDGDDWLTPDSVETLLNAIIEDEKKKNGTVDVVVGLCNQNYPDREESPTMAEITNSRLEYEMEKYRTMFLGYALRGVGIPELKWRECSMSAPWAKLYRKECLKQNNITFNSGQIYGEDQLFNLYTIQYARKIIVCNHPVYHYRSWDGAISGSLFFNMKMLDAYKNQISGIECFLQEFEYEESLKFPYELLIYDETKIAINILFNNYYLRKISRDETREMLNYYTQSAYFKGKLDINNPYYSHYNKIWIFLLHHKAYRTMYVLKKIEKCVHLH